MGQHDIDRSLAELTAEAADAPDKTRHIHVGPDALTRLGSWLASERPTAADVVVCDPNTKAAAGDAVVAALGQAGRAAELLVLEPGSGHDELVCDDDLIERLREQLAEAGEVNAIAVGAGTVTDTVKMACTQLKRPFVAVPTAASMNGYTSAIAAVLSKGVKRTLPTRQAEAIFADIGVVQRAPARLNLAGFGDLLSKPYSNADWLLSHLVRGVPYLERPAKLLDHAYDLLLERASAVGAAERDGIDVLMRTILLSGFTMAIAGTSSPASGGEHLISHYWDMVEHANHRPVHALHGTQVGIATRISAMLFERLVALRADEIDPDAAATRRADETWIADLTGAHPDLPAEVVSEMRDQLAAKQKHGAELRDEIAQLKTRWPEVRAQLTETLVPSARISAVLAEAHAPDRPSAIGIGRDTALHTVRVCRHMRSRYVALDLIDDLGVLDAWAAEVVEAVET